METLHPELHNTVAIIDRYQNEFLSPQKEDAYIRISGMDTCSQFLIDAYSTNNVAQDEGADFDVRKRLEEFTEGDTEFIGEFANYILFNMNYIETNLSMYQTSRDIEALTKMIHRVKPTIQMLGDTPFLNQLSNIESNWKSGNFDQSQIDEIISRVNFFQSQLVKIVNRKSNK
ncbi:MAG: hypothetical protein AAFY41_04225 [Bacteroidota bacterium]